MRVKFTEGGVGSTPIRGGRCLRAHPGRQVRGSSQPQASRPSPATIPSTHQRNALKTDRLYRPHRYAGRALHRQLRWRGRSPMIPSRWLLRHGWRPTCRSQPHRFPKHGIDLSSTPCAPPPARSPLRPGAAPQRGYGSDEAPSIVSETGNGRRYRRLLRLNPTPSQRDRDTPQIEWNGYVRSRCGEARRESGARCGRPASTCTHFDITSLNGSCEILRTSTRTESNLSWRMCSLGSCSAAGRVYCVLIDSMAVASVIDPT